MSKCSICGYDFEGEEQYNHTKEACRSRPIWIRHPRPNVTGIQYTRPDVIPWYAEEEPVTATTTYAATTATTVQRERYQSPAIPITETLLVAPHRHDLDQLWSRVTEAYALGNRNRLAAAVNQEWPVTPYDPTSEWPVLPTLEQE